MSVPVAGTRPVPAEAKVGLSQRIAEPLMKAKIVQNADVVTYVVVCDIGDEAVDTLTQFARSKRLKAAHITAIGSFEHATVCWFDRAARTYRPNPVDQQCELASLVARPRTRARDPAGPGRR